MYKKMTSVLLLALYCLTNTPLFAQKEGITDAGNAPIHAYPGDRGIYPALRSREERASKTARERRMRGGEREGRHGKETLRRRRERMRAQERRRRERRERERRARGKDKTPYGGATNRRRHGFSSGYHA